MSETTTASLPKRGDRIGRYEVVAEVAQGGMAMVYATRLSSIGGFGKLLAMKVLAPNLVGDREFVDMFLDEARIAAAVQHPNVVQVFDLGEHQGTPYLVMEYLRGHSLARTIRRSGELGHALPMGTLLAIIARAAEGLHAAHQTRDDAGNPLGIVHRDVSPQNIHVGYDGQVKVVDFGIAAARGRLTKTRSGHIKGKFHYLAPEQISKSRQVDHRADLWALGAMLWEVLTGRKLFRGDDDAETLWNVLNNPVKPVRDINHAVPKQVGELVASLLHRDMRKRPADGRVVAHILDAAAHELGGADPAAIGEVMTQLFGRDRAVEDERLRAAVSEEPAPIKEDASTSDVADPALPAATRRRGILSGQSLAIGVSVILATALVLAIVRPWENPGTDPPEPVAAAPTESGGAETPEEAVERQSVTVEIDPDVRLVLVDGQRRDDRPLVLELTADQAAAVEIVAPDGEMIRRAVTIDDDGTTLSLDREEPTPRVRDRPRPNSPGMNPSPMNDTMASPMNGDSPLIDPYQ